MSIFVLMPSLSPTMKEGHLVKWHKSVGDKVTPGDLLFDVQTDKAIMEVEASEAGTIYHICGQPGSIQKVGQTLAVLRESGDTDAEMEEAISKISSSHTASVESEMTDIKNPKNNEMSIISYTEDHSQKSSLGEIYVDTSSSNCEERVLSSPLARKVASQLGIRISDVVGTGPRGRIRSDDVRAYSEHRSYTAIRDEVCKVKKHTEAMHTDIPISSMRQIIAERLSESRRTIPHFSLSIMCRADALWDLRSSVCEALGSKETSINDFMVRACALALEDVPAMNTQWTPSAIRQFSGVDLSVAVSLESGLITPIIFSAHKRSVRDIARSIRDLAARARLGTLEPREYQGGTFTISNLGMMGIDRFEAIINPPQSGILAIGSVTQRAVVNNAGSVTAGKCFDATLSADHRLVDGKDGAAFLNAFRRYIENPVLLLYA